MVDAAGFLARLVRVGLGPHHGHVEAGRHGKPAVEDAPGVAPRGDHRLHELAVAAGIVGHQPVAHAERRLERHPARGHLAEAVGGELDPARPERGRGLRVGEPALVVEPVRDARLQQTEPRVHPGRTSDLGGGDQRLEDVAVVALLPRLGQRPRHIEADHRQPHLGRECDVLEQSFGAHVQDRAPLHE